MPTYTLVLRNHHPARLNELLAGHWGPRHRRKKFDRDIIALEARSQRTPKATTARRVSVEIVLGPRQRAGDPDAYWKSLLDALATAGLLVDDRRQCVELGPVTFTRGPAKRTAITLEDLPPAPGRSGRASRAPSPTSRRGPAGAGRACR